MVASDFLISTQGTVRALEPSLPGHLRELGRQRTERAVPPILQSPATTVTDFGGKEGAKENLHLFLAHVNKAVYKIYSVQGNTDINDFLLVQQCLICIHSHPTMQFLLLHSPASGLTL